jgi:hypothetical protein
MSDKDALDLVTTYIAPRPIHEVRPIAWAVLRALWFGPEAKNAASSPSPVTPALGEVATRFYEVNSTLHLWTDEPGMQTVRELGGAIFGCLFDDVPSAPGIHIHSLRFVSGRYMRDPGGKLAHGVLTVRSVVEVLQ